MVTQKGGGLAAGIGRWFVTTERCHYCRRLMESKITIVIDGVDYMFHQSCIKVGLDRVFKGKLEPVQTMAKNMAAHIQEQYKFKEGES